MTDVTDTDELPRWSPRDGLDIRDLANTLEHIRRMALAHAFGGAFEPKHMNDIANACSQALCGQPNEAPVDMTSPQWRALVTERHQAWLDQCDDEVVALARYVDSGDADLDDDEESNADTVDTDVPGPDELRPAHTSMLIGVVLRVTGLTPTEVGALLRVSVNAVNAWSRGARMNEAHFRRLEDLNKRAQRVNSPTFYNRRDSIMSPHGGQPSIYQQWLAETWTQPIDPAGEPAYFEAAE